MGVLLLGLVPAALDRHHQEQAVWPTLIAVGDVMLGREVAEAARTHGPDYPFAALNLRALAPRSAPYIIFGNLECPICRPGQPLDKPIVFRTPPDSAFTLRRAGFAVLCLANNHSLDQGRLGLTETLEHLTAAGVCPVGAGATAEEARRLVIINRGLRIGFLAYSTLPTEQLFPAANQPSVAKWDPLESVRDIKAARHRCDVLVVSMHWGQEGSYAASAFQRETARQISEAGAALILGHHPHAPQEIETIGRTLVAYSLGNYVFDDHGVFDGASNRANEGLVLQVQLGSDGWHSLSYRHVRPRAGQAREALPPRRQGGKRESAG